MVDIIGLIIIVFLLSACAVAIAQLVRLHHWSRYVDTVIDQTFNESLAGDRNVRYPDIRASYDNFKWYQPLNYNFDSMIVYDDPR